jgi:predicted  nucleic acid-binding Zn-ribbon protein
MLMKTRLVLAALSVALVMGCNNKQEELQRQLAQSQNDKTSLQVLISERDKYLDEVMKSVNEIYADLEQARTKEGRLMNRTVESELPGKGTTIDARQQLLLEINDVGSVLKENRSRIAGLQVRIRKYQGQIKGLDTLITNLKASLAEREHSIAQLQTRVQGLEVSLAEKTQAVKEREMTIDGQRQAMNTGYYVVGTKSELKKRGIIKDEGGFLWGLLGSTTIMASGVDTAEFLPIDKSADQTIHVQGKIDDILPPRENTFFATAKKDDDSSDLRIVRPEKFWQDRYLVIIID